MKASFTSLTAALKIKLKIHNTTSFNKQKGESDVDIKGFFWLFDAAAILKFIFTPK